MDGTREAAGRGAGLCLGMGVTRMRRLVCVVLGTRPEAIKMAPVVRALRGSGSKVVVVTTGQHPDLAPVMLAEAGLKADFDVRVHRPGMGPDALLALLLARLPETLRTLNPDMVLVQGDTTSAFAGALSAYYSGIPLGHVEAGLRSGDLTAPFPEEAQRRLIAPIAQVCFAPTESARTRLLEEGVSPLAVTVTGNTGIDALLSVVGRLSDDGVELLRLRERFAFLEAEGPPIILATAHRRENRGPRMWQIAEAIQRLALEHVARVVIPVHPSEEAGGVLKGMLRDVPGVHLLKPLDHGSTVFVMQRSALVLTDSGGLQEEAPALGKRVLVLRDVTERPEGVAAGVAELVGTEPWRVVSAVRSALAKPQLAPTFPYGDGRAAIRIARVVQAWLDARSASCAPSSRINGRNVGKLVAMGAALSTMTG